MNEVVKNQVDVVDFLLSMVEIGEFAILEFVPADGSEVRPFSQAAREPDGSWYLEVVSHHYLSRFLWPLDMRALRRLGGHPPATQEDNWWRYAEHCEGSDEVAWIPRGEPAPGASMRGGGRVPCHVRQVPAASRRRTSRSAPRDRHCEGGVT